jgi:hypothetical protein
MAIPGIQEIQALATKYSKAQLQKMAQRGLIDPTKAVMAGMMIDRIQKQNMQMPQQTVADEVLGANVLRDRFGNVVRSGSGQAIRTGVQQDRFGNVIRPSERQSAGITALPSNLPEEEMAGGGLVAFAEGGDVPGYASRGLVSAADAFRRSGMNPDQIAEQFASAGPGVPVAPAQSEPQGVMLPGGLKLKDYPVRPEPTLQQELASATEAERAVGLNDEAMFKQIREEDKTRREELKARKDQALGNAYIMGGFGLLGARKGEEFDVLSTVGRQGVMQYGAVMKEIRETENDIRKSERALILAENQLKRDKSAKAKENYDNKMKAYEDSKAKSYEQYNDSIKTLANLNEKYYSVDKQSATNLAVAQINRGTQLAIHAMPGAEQRLLTALQESPALMDTYQKMKSFGSKEEARAKAALALEKEWNDIISDTTGLSLKKVKQMYPKVETGDDYIREKMKVFEQYYKNPRSTSADQGVVVTTPQGDVQFNTKAEADAFKQKFGLK